MDPFLTLGVMLLGFSCGYYVGRHGTVDVLGPLIHEMSERIQELETQLAKQDRADEQDGVVESISDKVQVEILEQWIRK